MTPTRRVERSHRHGPALARAAGGPWTLRRLAAVAALGALAVGCSVGFDEDPAQPGMLTGAATQTFQDGVAPSASYAGTADTFLSENAPTATHGAATRIELDGDDPGGTGRDVVALVRWDVSGIPTGSTVNSASVTVNVTNSSTGRYEIYEARRAWAEGEASWNRASAASAWEVPGARGASDRGSTVLGTLTASATGQYTVALNAAGVAVVQSWLNDPTTNRGFVIANASTRDGLGFHSSESTTASARPRLAVGYTPPSPGDAGGSDVVDGSVTTSVTLVPRGATWRYLDNGTDPGTAWRGPSFDDGAWRSGAAQLGYGDGDEATVVSYGPSSSSKYITTYFRRAFTVDDPSAVTSLALRLLRDDGAVVYLNGAEVFRSNMPTGTVTATTLASTAIGGSSETTFYEAAVDPARLVRGTNVIAVEVHQGSAGSTDLSFDLGLVASTSGGGGEDAGTDAALDGSADGSTGGSTDAALDGSADGSTGGSTDGSASGSLDGSTDGEAADAGGPTLFAVIGDYGYDSTPEADVAALVRGWNPEFIITSGDNNYRGASTIDSDIGKHYSAFIFPYRGRFGTGASENRFWPCLGNVDWTTPGASAYLDYFELPNNERYYDFVRGPVHFFAIDSDNNEPDGTSRTSRQALWLHDRLAASTSRWNVVYFHHPPYSSGYYGSTSRMQWPFAAWGADVVISGHEHSYERVVRDGVTYLVVGTSGKDSLRGFNSPITGSMFRYYADWGAMRVRASSTEMNFEFINRRGTVIDTHTLR